VQLELVDLVAQLLELDRQIDDRHRHLRRGTIYPSAEVHHDATPALVGDDEAAARHRALARLEA
jgi:hypothetical protein